MFPHPKRMAAIWMQREPATPSRQAEHDRSMPDRSRKPASQSRTKRGKFAAPTGRCGPPTPFRHEGGPLNNATERPTVLGPLGGGCGAG